VFAIGDVTGLGLVTHAIGQGRLVAETVHYQLMHAPRAPEIKQAISYDKIKREYYEASTGDFTIENEGNKCLSCASCRDCHICEATCYWGAISRRELKAGRLSMWLMRKNALAAASAPAPALPEYGR